MITNPIDDRPVALRHAHLCRASDGACPSRASTSPVRHRHVAASSRALSRVPLPGVHRSIETLDRQPPGRGTRNPGSAAFFFPA